MNDLDRIKEIEEIFGFPLNRVEFDNLFDEKSFQTDFGKGARSYSINDNGFVTGLALDCCPVFLLPERIILSFTNLRKLSLRKTYLPAYSFLGELKSLTSLDLRNNQIRGVSFLGELKSLTSLDLRSNQISDASFLGELKSLTSLDLGSNRLSDASFLGELKLLTSLDLSYSLISDWSFLGELKSLTTLYLRSNWISDASVLGGLKSLTTLYLRNNEISDASFLGELKSLRILDLRQNEGLEKKIPEEILGDLGNAQKIINYYLKTTEGETKPLNEAKIVVVGEADFGKTLLIRRLIHNDYIDTKSTTGIKIERWKDVPVNDQNVQLNVWDFGGQEIMHSTHQFFFTRRTLYILVVNARRNEDRNKTEEWLKRIQSFGGDSPVIVVGSKVDENQRDDSKEKFGYFDIDRRELKGKFPNIAGFFGVCSDVRKTEYDGKWQDFKESLIAEIGKFENLHQPFPADWFAVKDFLEKMKEDNKPHISNGEYLSSCIKRNVEDETSQNTIREFLNDIGTVIYFKGLFDKMIFNPEWITNGVYALTDNPGIIRNKGELEFSELDKILTPKGYNADEHKFILDLMRQFELCVDIEKGKRFLIPDLLLEVEKPFVDKWPNTLGFQYHYETYLKNIFTKFVVRMYSLVYEKSWWKNGVILEHEECKALVNFDASGKKVTINISGESIKKRQNLLAIIRREFKEIQGEFASLPLKEFVAHPRIKLTDENGRDKDLLRDYDELIKAEEDKIAELYVKELRRTVPISEWLDGIETKEERLRKKETFDERRYPRSEKTEDNRQLLPTQSDLTKLRNEKEKLGPLKERLDERADVWATVTRMLIGVLLLSGLGYLVYWCIRNFDWVKENWNGLEAIVVLISVVVSTSLIVFSLVKRKKISEEMAVNWIEAKIQKRLYGRHNFELDRYNDICAQIEQKEGEIDIKRGS